ncbi:MAG: methyltransferase domain-containing protein [Phycisphaeraceae bacterium]|nr:methyltransferase domain-containing protein [Phycisphaeraceae bacterium]
MLRRLSPELMDDPTLPPEALAGALSGLSRLNALSGAFGRTFREIERESRRHSEPLRVLDIACARGDFVVRAARLGEERGLRATFAGCDVNPNSIRLARQSAASRGLSCDFLEHDAVSSPLPSGFSCCVASLFFHHLEASDAVRLLQNMAVQCDCVIVNDLVRSPVNLAMIAVASRAVTRSPVVHADAVLSARAAFTRDEMRELAECAGLRGATIKFGGISRMMLVWRKPN